MTIRPAKASDAPTIAQVHVQTWRAAYRGQLPDAVLDALSVESRTVFWQERLAQAPGNVFVAEDGGALAAFCDLISSRDKDADPQVVAEIVAIYVVPSHWRKGVGRRLYDRALAVAREQGYQILTLWVLATNNLAHAFYRALGFNLDGATKTETTNNGSELRQVRFRIEI